MKSTTFPQKFVSKLLLGVIFASSFVGYSAPIAQAQGSYETSLVTITGGGNITMAPGEIKTISAEFLNTGSATWKNDGDGYISVYTYGPKYRRSLFDPGTWLWGDHTARMREVSVAPKGKATISFDLKAPQTTGYYEEVFNLASEDRAWVTNGVFTLKITVKDATPVANSNTSAPVSVTDGYQANLTVQSATNIKTQAGRPLLFTAGFTNTGSKTWNNFAIVKPDVALATNVGDFSHPSWNGSKLVYQDMVIKPGEMAISSFSFTAPKTNGTYTAEFQLSANGVNVPGAVVEIPVEVTGGSAEIIDAPVLHPIIETNNYIEQPVMRIGFLIVDEETENKVVITSEESAFDLLDINGSLLAQMNVNQNVTAYYQNGYYFYDIGNGVVKSSLGLRFVPKTDHAIMKIVNFDRRVTRNKSFPDNEFRGSLELRYNDYKDRTWLINELGIEYYLRGLAETSNISPIEYQKALVTAARTYAFYHWTNASKYRKEFFHISSYSWDQVYNGYGQEKRAPKITQAIQETSGNVVTYDGNLALTPYFSRSDGRTRNFSDVWNGSKPWLVAVSVPCDAGKTLWGHGVGLSASGALCMANQGQMWDEILKHFYTGITLDRRWQ